MSIPVQGRIPPVKYWRGVNVGGLFNEASYLAFYDLEFKSDDIIALTFAKCGTTYLQKLLYLITRLDGDGNEPEDKVSAIAQGQLYPEWLHTVKNRRPFPDVTLDEVLYQPSPRIFCTHMTPEFLPPQAPTGKMVCMIRNPKDAFVSFHSMIDKIYKKNQGPDRFLPWLTKEDGELGCYEGYMPGGDITFYCDYFAYLRKMQEYADAHPNQFLALYYEEVLEDVEGNIKKLADFLGYELTDAKLEAIKQKSSFQSMQAETANTNRAMFFRKGGHGDWKNHVDVDTPQGPSPSAEQWARFDEELEKLQDLPLAQPIFKWMN
ncbi:amine sulfotransferase-like isoform X1 [Thraustotheca clavata]|uniref:Amine sulfotransferase-like isoform X1 n=1 Tax=Thraustotheca clavata TaxID=74557 RepID=A0A1W0A2B8_9STRA|nr:amine sulfotransferase-like isoform X1 [Thraustotheca clavata]